MKRLFTLITILAALCTTSQAQVDGTFVFTDKDGNTVPDGTTIVVDQLENGQMRVPLGMKNVSGEKHAVSIYENIDAKPVERDANGNVIADWQSCILGNCMKLSATGYGPKSVVSESYSEKDLETEWLPTEGHYATWTATLQIHVFDYSSVEIIPGSGLYQDQAGNTVIGHGPKVTVKFVYRDPAAINATQADGQQEVARYSLAGNRLAGPAHGINIVRLANGKAVKKIVK